MEYLQDLADSDCLLSMKHGIFTPLSDFIRVYVLNCELFFQLLFEITQRKNQKEIKMSGLYLIQVAMCFCFMGGYYGQPLYEDRCRNNLVNGMDQRLKEAYGKI